MKFLPKMYLWRRKIALKFGSDPLLDPDLGIFRILQYRNRQRSDLCENVTTDVSLEEEVLHKILKVIRIHLGRGLHSNNALIVFIFLYNVSVSVAVSKHKNFHEKDFPSFTTLCTNFIRIGRVCNRYRDIVAYCFLVRKSRLSL